jgi:hypothetical protein
MVIARPSAATSKIIPPLPLRLRDDPESQEPLFGQVFEDGVTKKRTVPNARELVAGFNRRSNYEELLDINDPEQIEWIDLGPEQKYCTGEAVQPFFSRSSNSRH